MKTFQELKELILKIAQENDACESQTSRAENSENFQELLTVIKESPNWCYNNGIFNDDVIGLFPDEELVNANIFYKKENVIQTEGLAIYISSTSKHYGSSTSEHYDSSTSEHYDSSTSKHYGSSTSEHYDSSTSKHYDSSTSEHYDSSTYGNVYVLKNPEIIKDSAIVRERSTNKVYVRKGKFEIVELQ